MDFARWEAALIDAFRPLNLFLAVGVLRCNVDAEDEGRVYLFVTPDSERFISVATVALEPHNAVRMARNAVLVAAEYSSGEAV